MKFAVLDTVYQGYVDHLYRDGTLAGKSWAEQYRATVDGGFPTLSAWVEPLESRGHETLDIWGNHMPLQRQWCIENDAAHLLDRPARDENGRDLFVDIVIEQIRRFKPDVILGGYLYSFDTAFLNDCKPYYKLAIGQHAAALPESDFSGYDAIVSSLPNQVEWFTAHGVPGEFIKLAFDVRIGERLIHRPPAYDLMFAGQVSGDHKNRQAALLALGQTIDIDIFGALPWDEAALAKTRIRAHGALWGNELYQTIADSKIAFNCHIDAATTYANNLRLYEVAGAGALLLTDDKINMSDILIPGKECLAYRSVEECVALAKKYLADDDARNEIAAAGRRRMLAEHTYFHRVDRLLDVVARYFPT